MICHQVFSHIFTTRYIAIRARIKKFHLRADLEESNVISSAGSYSAEMTGTLACTYIHTDTVNAWRLT